MRGADHARPRIGEQDGAAIRRGDADPEAGHAGISAFLVEAGLPGISIGPAYRKMGQQGTQVADVIFTDCRVPATALRALATRNAVPIHHVSFQRDAEHLGNLLTTLVLPLGSERYATGNNATAQRRLAREVQVGNTSIQIFVGTSARDDQTVSLAPDGAVKVERVAGGVRPPPSANPYKGLEAFEEADTDRFIETFQRLMR